MIVTEHEDVRAVGQAVQVAGSGERVGVRIYLRKPLDRAGESELGQPHVRFGEPKSEEQAALELPLAARELQALLLESLEALRNNPSAQTSQKVLLNVLTQALELASTRAEGSDAKVHAAMLDVMERSAQFVEANVAVPQFNTHEASGVRTLVFNVYHRLAKVLGRNTPEAVKADTKAMLIALGDRIVHRSGQGKRGELTPSQHIQEIIVPMADADMEPHLYVQGMYNIPSMMNFHSLLRVWRQRGKDLGKIRLS